MGKMRKKIRKLTEGWTTPDGSRKRVREAKESSPLPDTITCALCERDLPRARFSHSALRRLTSEIRRNGMDVLNNQQVARCDGCGTQSRPELHCMSCNEVRPIDEFAYTQRQYDQPDNLQLDERDKAPAGQIPQDAAKLLWEDVTAENIESPVAAPEASEMTEHGMSKESSPAKQEETPKPMKPYDQKLAEEWMYGLTIGDMSFDDLFEDDEDEDTWTGANQW
ncbi:uncharacterized protein N7496_002951 [Penicillium cataractarum]|uniref:Stc1 domain-containing protein n=1 Tax=Penicillium cataractarum TaxID=2100454 RepID=A0A9W9SL20_9EURO|nr:uncharacterized protein N7496_002951 [Penicillium cataractarum]KAJ5380523.1 hypothetical protein N7496_002951 [Penicillium cataractarum]